MKPGKALLLSMLLVCAPLAAAAQEAEFSLPTPLEQADAMFRLAQRVQASGAAQAVQQIALRVAARQSGAEALAVERRDLTERRARLAADAGLDPAARRARLDEVETALTVNAERLAAAFPGWREITAPEPAGLAEVRALLAADEALIALHQSEEALFVWLVARDRVLWHRVGIPGSDAPGLVAAFRDGMGLQGTLRARWR